ncbi:hypothetical protein Q4Q35_08710 [Flavivirga aquimarina]|uniref:Lipocalin-like domain-containing protein n=1 Tax=Flavivirga aquimarina TaxID=2027862 RepID=A0ABT8W9S3_9FLAO|nr:hypothetical protein [Flavivirga aquimarina]MDO5969888.1 hypothetical protein [Flavivirga aquimarina]
MKNIIFILIFFFAVIQSNSQCEICGIYKGTSKERAQKLIIKKDSTFVYDYTDNWATLMGATTKGTWKIVGDEIELNSDYNDEEFTIKTEKIDLCGIVPNYLASNCNKLIKIQVVNSNDEYIWHLRSVMLNEDTSQISTIMFEDYNDYNSSVASSFFVGNSINKINIFNGFYDEFVVLIDDSNVNYVKIKGNFADILWYTYIKKERWKIKKNSLVKNKRFGKFKKI